LVDCDEICNYDVIMRAQIVRIGNSQGIRIPKMLLEESGISGEVELEIAGEGILIRKVRKPRAGWDEAFAAFADADDDISPVEVSSGFDRKDWQW
jgi:antitoxin MazE